MSAIIARIALRYAAGALVAAGYMDADLGSQIGADPDLLILVGGALGVSVELAYALAKKCGWGT
ncbi:hypothetical protein J2Y63_002393 [Shinella sp. BE166]|uniref:hypothetical protein n=1 Tax=Shinella sp. BE166 TaxID=3373918 RepID=UPI003EBAACF8